MNEQRIIKQIQDWRDSYIDISEKNNNLLNQNKECSGGIRLLTTESCPYTYFWNLASGRMGQVSVNLDTGSLHNSGATNRISWAPIAKEDLPADERIGWLDGIYTKGRETIVQRGENPICLTFGRFDWSIKVPDSGSDYSRYGRVFEVAGQTYLRLSTPVLFVPVIFSHMGKLYSIRPIPADANTITVNPSLLIRFEKTEGYPFPLPDCGQLIEDALSFDIEGYFAKLKQHFNTTLNPDEYHFDDNYVAMDTYDYDKICMYRDLVGHEKDLAANHIMRGLFGEEMNLSSEEHRALAQLDRFGTSAKIANAVTTDRSFQILDSDSSQCEAIERFKNGESFVLQGPPGTGKTQTIINLIAEAMVRGKKVLFVSGKMSALNTVVKKLQLMPNVNIDKHCLLILGESEEYKNNIADTYGKLAASYNAFTQPISTADYRDNMQRLETTRERLLSYNTEMYDTKNGLEMSIYDIIGRVLMLGYKGEYICLKFDERFLEGLTRDTLYAHTQRLAKVEEALSKLIRRSGSIEADAWYGYQRYLFDGHDREQLVEFCQGIKRKLGVISPAFDLPWDDGDPKTPALKKVLADLRNRPLSSICSLCDRSIQQDIHNLFAKAGLQDEIRLVSAELDNAKYYRDNVARVGAQLSTIPDVDIEDIRCKLNAASRYGELHIRQLRLELANVKALLGANTDGFARINAMELADLEAFLGVIDEYLELQDAQFARKQEILSTFKEDIFDYDYGKLQQKLTTKWRDNVAANKAPLGFGGQIKGLVALCNNYTTEFDIKTVADWLIKIDMYNQGQNRLAVLRNNIQEVGLKDFTRNVLEYFKELVRRYFAAKEDYRKANLFSEESFDFLPFLTQIQTVICDVMSAGSSLGITANMTVDEMKSLADDLAVVIRENKRLDADMPLRNVLPALYRGCATKWEALVTLLEIVTYMKSVTNEYRFSVQDAWNIFDSAMGVFHGEVLQAIGEVLDMYRLFYANADWFDPQYIAYHDASVLTYDGLYDWVEQIRDLNHIDEYLCYRVEVRNLEGSYEARFFDAFKNKGRRAFPFDSMRRHYEISILFAYYEWLLQNSVIVSRLSGRDDLRRLQDQFVAADKKAIEFNRSLVDVALSRRIEKNTSKHAYLNATRDGSNYSVRKLLKDRYDSIIELAPCLMMSVYSVSKLLPYDKYKFDVVIFDEASQIPMEDALPAIMRAEKQIVIAGDPQQMPAISYFKTKVAVEGDDEEDSMDCMSLIDFAMNMADSKLRTYHLNMHYRSNHESLINYSNQHFYGGSLVSFPSPKMRTADFGLYDYCMCDEYEFIPGGKGENECEAGKVAMLIRDHFTKYPLPKEESEIEAYNEEHSLGVIVFGTHQKELLRRIMQKDDLLKKVVEFGDNRVFSITTVDDIQGDEMTNMVLSLTYGRDPKGNVTAAWGHMNQPVARKKFNVAVTRARDNLKFVHSVTANDIASADKLSYVADYLRQFGAGLENQFASDNAYNTDFISAIGALCENVVGKDRVVYNFGASARTYRVPVSILSQDKTRVVLGVMCEKNRLADGFSVREYTRTCEGILRHRGWERLYETNAMQWMRNYMQEYENLLKQLNQVKEI